MRPQSTNEISRRVRFTGYTTPHPVGWPSTVASKHWQSDWKPTSIRPTFMGRLFVIQLLRSSFYSRVKTTPQIKSDSHSSRNIFTTQYRGRISGLLGKKLRQTTGCSVVFNTRKLKTVLPSLKSPIQKELRSSVVYKFSCSGCNSCYVCQTVRHLQRYRGGNNV